MVQIFFMSRLYHHKPKDCFVTKQPKRDSILDIVAAGLKASSWVGNDQLVPGLVVFLCFCASCRYAWKHLRFDQFSFSWNDSSGYSQTWNRPQSLGRGRRLGEPAASQAIQRSNQLLYRSHAAGPSIYTQEINRYHNKKFTTLSLDISLHSYL